MKPKFPADVAKGVLRELLPLLQPACEKRADGSAWLIVAGSLRRRKAEVGDVELVYCPAQGMVKDGLFERPGCLMDAALSGLLISRVLTPRLSKDGRVSWGPKNKLAVHVETGLPVDLFATKQPDFWNYAVCRTGSAEHNIKLAQAAQARGLKWLPYNGGFEVIDVNRASAVFERSLHSGQVIAARTERDVFTLAGLAYLEPWQR